MPHGCDGFAAKNVTILLQSPCRTSPRPTKRSPTLRDRPPMSLRREAPDDVWLV